MKYSVIIPLIMLAGLLSLCKHKTEPVVAEKDSSVAVPQGRDSSSTITDNQINTKEGTSDNPSWKTEDIVSGTAYYRLRYCGGARPTPEIEESFRQEYALVNQNIRFTNASDPADFVNTKTNANGNFSVGLRPGTYNFFLLSTPGSKVPPNPECQKYYDRSYGQIVVPAGGATNMHLLFSFPCDPCSPPRP